MTFRGILIWLLAFVPAYLCQHAIYALAGFSYNMFREGLSWKLGVDMGTWAAMWGFWMFAVHRALPGRKRRGSAAGVGGSGQS